MASTNFKLFDENKVNMMSDTEYNINTQRLNGVQAGIASSQLQNKTLYQTSLMSYALAQLMNQNGIDSNDTTAVSAFVNGLSDTLVQKVLDKATEQMAITGTDNSHYMTPSLVKKAQSNIVYEEIIELDTQQNYFEIDLDKIKALPCQKCTLVLYIDSKEDYLVSMYAYRSDGSTSSTYASCVINLDRCTISKESVSTMYCNFKKSKPVEIEYEAVPNYYISYMESYSIRFCQLVGYRYLRLTGINQTKLNSNKLTLKVFALKP